MKIKSKSKERASIIKRIDEYIYKQSKLLENKVYESLIDMLVSSLEIKENKIISSSISYKAASNISSLTFDNSKFRKKIASEIFKLYSFNKIYFNQFGNITDAKERQILASVGIEKNDNNQYRINQYSWLGQLMDIKEPLEKIKKEVIKSIASGNTFLEFKRGIKQFIKKSDKFGLIESHLITQVNDQYSKFDRAVGNSFKDEFTLEYAFYQGGEIKTSRPMCKFLNNRILHISDIEKLNSIDFKGKNDNYNPLVDMGGYNCRHFWDWIDEDTAIVLGYEKIDFSQFNDNG